MLIVERRSRRSRDHLCVSDHTGQAIGHYDFRSDEVVAEDPRDRLIIEAVVAGWRAREAVDAGAPAPTPVEPSRPSLLPRQWRRRAEAEQVIVPTVGSGRVQGGPVGGHAHDAVREQLRSHLGILQQKDARWRIFHDLHNAEERLSVEHLVVSPNGMFMVVPLDLSGSRVVIDGDDLHENGEHRDDIAQTRTRALHVGRALGVATRLGYDVIPVVTPLGHVSLEIDSPPKGVFVVPRGNLIRWLRSREVLFDDTRTDILVDMVSELAGTNLSESLPTP